MSDAATVLIVDDEANMRVALSALVRRAGHRVLEASDGEQALEQLREHRVSAVLSDLKMPHMNGLDLLDEVQRLGLGLPVILLTAHGTIGSAVDALKRGSDGLACGDLTRSDPSRGLGRAQVVEVAQSIPRSWPEFAIRAQRRPAARNACSGRGRRSGLCRLAKCCCRR